MKSVLDTYLGWEQPRHQDGCKRPSWEVAVRTDESVYRHEYRSIGEPPVTHRCRDEECGHSGSYRQVSVRIVCRSCGAAQVVRGEDTADTGTTTTSTQHLGYGLAPRPMAGLLLWPGQPWLPFGRDGAEHPHDYVVTRTGVRQVTADTVVGQLIQGTGKLGGVVWATLAVPDPDGPYGYGTPVRYAARNDGRGQGGSPLRSVGAAARWVGARLAEQSRGTA